MKTNLVLLGGLALASPFLLAFVSSGDKIAFTPAEGTTLTKTFTLSQEFTVDDMSMKMNGEEMPMEMEMDMELRQVTTVTDTYDKMAEGKPSQLTRLFKDGSMEMSLQTKVNAMGNNQEEDATGEGTTELKDKIVIFTWDKETSAYKKKYDEDTAGEESYLEDLVEDMDLRALLPEGEVSVDAEWVADNSIIADMFAAGGNWQWELEMEGIDSPSGGPSPEMMSDLRTMLGDTLEGDVNCKYTGTKEIDGNSYLAIEVRIAVDSTTDLSEYMAETMEESDEMPEGVNISIEKMDMESHIEGKGILLWDAAGGHIHNFTYEGEFTMQMDMSMAIDAMGQEFNNDMYMEMSGEMNLDITTSK